MPKNPRVIIIDDDPAHLRIYGWVLERGGYVSTPVLVKRNSLQLPDGHADLVLLDYALGTDVKAADVAQKVKSTFPSAPIIVISDLFGMPQDIAPLATAFVQKGDPENLLRVLDSILSGNSKAD